MKSASSAAPLVTELHRNFPKIFDGARDIAAAARFRLSPLNYACGVVLPPSVPAIHTDTRGAGPDPLSRSLALSAVVSPTTTSCDGVK